MINRFDQEYLKLCTEVFNNGFWIDNERTGKRCLKIHGFMMKFDLSDGSFPLLTLRKMYHKGMVGELLGFIRGYDNAADFRKLGCNFWDANANETEGWLANPHRKGTDDLGPIYGVQARRWNAYKFEKGAPPTFLEYKVDQLKDCIDKISKGIDDRRLIVTHMNPGEVNQMALYPCHMFYQFGLRGDYLDLAMYQRSADIPLGVPTNIASYSLLLNLVARITNKRPGVFTHFLFDSHFYEDQVEGMRELMFSRQGHSAPKLWIDSKIKTLEDLETWVTQEDIGITDYKHDPAIKFPFAK